MPPPLFGQLVHIAPQNFVGRPNSEGGNGFVQKDHADGSFDIRYCMDGTVEKNINRLRITSLNPLVTTARRTNGADVSRPSILAPSHQPPQQRSSPSTQQPTPPTSPRGIQHIIIQSRAWSKYDRGQWDNASPHTERFLVALIAELFGEYGWVWTTQPANSPLTNIMDAAIFPALAKMVSGLQGVVAGGHYLHCEVLWQLVKKAWDDYPLDRIARTFVHHSQVAAAIYACDGGDEFVQERNGLSFGVRKACSLDYGDGEVGGDVLDLTSIEPRERVAKGVIVEEVQDGLDLEGHADKKLKYDVPNMEQHDISEYLTYDELAFIAGDVADADYDNFDDTTKARYDKFVEAWYKKQDEMATE